MTSKHTIGDAPIEPEYRELMNKLAKTLDKVLNGNRKGADRKVGFCLMMFNFGDGPGRCNYISNANRDDVIVLLREQLARFQGQPEMKGHA